MYTITFVDGEIFLGGEPENSLWNEMPNKPIKKIQYILLGHTVIFENYEVYNHLVERTHFILNSNKERISKIILMAKKNNFIYCFVFDLFSREIYSEVYEFGKEYYGKSTTGWKEGIKEQSIRYNISKNNS